MDFTQFFQNILVNWQNTLFFTQMNPSSAFIVILLIVMSIISWYLIFRKIAQFFLLFHQARRWQQFLSEQIKQNNPLVVPPRSFFSNPFATVFERTQATLATYSDKMQVSEWITRTLRMELQQEKIRLETGLNWLASIGSTAPFLGLLGTVLEIYMVLKGLGGSHAVSLDVIAPPIGNALILTAMGLAVAIPAALGYNALLRLHRVFLNRLDNFGHQLHIFLILKEKIRDE